MARSSTTRIGRGVGMGWGVAGAGWGGPAKGAGSSQPKKPISSTERAMELNARRGTPDALARAEEKAHTTAILQGVLFDIAMDDAAPPQARIAAAVALDNRLNGMPAARIEHSGGMTLTHEARAALAANARARYAGDSGGTD